MKKHIIILIILSGSLGCVPSKKTTLTDKSKADTEINKSGTVKLSIDSIFSDNTKTVEALQTDKNRDEIKTENTVVKNTTTNYDTSKPVDPGTGKPPISSISETTSEKNTNTRISETEMQRIRKEIESDIRLEYESRYNAKVDSIARTNEQNNIKQTEKEKEPKPLKLFIAGLIIPILLYGIIWSRKKIKSIVK